MRFNDAVGSFTPDQAAALGRWLLDAALEVLSPVWYFDGGHRRLATAVLNDDAGVDEDRLLRELGAEAAHWSDSNVAVDVESRIAADRILEAHSVFRSAYRHLREGTPSHHHGVSVLVSPLDRAEDLEGAAWVQVAELRGVADPVLWAALAPDWDRSAADLDEACTNLVSAVGQ